MQNGKFPKARNSTNTPKTASTTTGSGGTGWRTASLSSMIHQRFCSVGISSWGSPTGTASSDSSPRTQSTRETSSTSRPRAKAYIRTWNKIIFSMAPGTTPTPKPEPSPSKTTPTSPPSTSKTTWTGSEPSTTKTKKDISVSVHLCRHHPNHQASPPRQRNRYLPHLQQKTLVSGRMEPWTDARKRKTVVEGFLCLRRGLLQGPERWIRDVYI